jgi:hypothetical protein
VARNEFSRSRIFSNAITTSSSPTNRKKLVFLKEILSTIEANPKITIRELAQSVDQKLDKEGTRIQKRVFRADKIFDSVRILGWIRYLIIEKNGRVPREDDQDGD